MKYLRSIIVGVALLGACAVVPSSPLLAQGRVADLDRLDIVDSVADLQTARVLDGGKVRTLGYYAAADGGGNVYVYHATGRSGITADGGFYINGPGADDYFSALDQTGWANPLQWGVKASNSADDDGANSDAVANMRAASTKIKWPAGWIWLDTTIQMQPDEQWIGQGMRRTTLMFRHLPGSNNPCVIGAKKCLIQSMRLSGGADHQFGLVLDKAEGYDPGSDGSMAEMTFRDVALIDFERAVQLKDTFTVLFDNCYLSGNDYGYYFDETSTYINEITVRNGAIETSDNDGVYVGQVRGFTLDGVTIQGNTGKGINKPSVPSERAARVSVKHCYFESNGGHDIYVAGNADNWNVMDNEFSQTATAIEFAGGNNNAIGPNRFLYSADPEASRVTIGSSAFRTRYTFGYNINRANVEVITDNSATTEYDGASSVANVRHYGAKGNGSDDDTDAIQAAIDSGLPVYFPAGTYIVSSQLDVETDNQIIDLGIATVKRADAFEGHLFYITGLEAQIKNGVIDGNYANQSGSRYNFFEVSCANDRVRVTNVKVTGNYGYAIRGYAVNGLQIKDNIVLDSGQYGIYVTEGGSARRETQISGNYIKMLGGISAAVGIYVTGRSNLSSRYEDFIINQNVIIGNGGANAAGIVTQLTGRTSSP